MSHVACLLLTFLKGSPSLVRRILQFITPPSFSLSMGSFSKRVKVICEVGFDTWEHVIIVDLSLFAQLVSSISTLPSTSSYFVCGKYLLIQQLQLKFTTLLYI